ncbi:MAG: hypothetical protein JEY99_05975 [Spirochaetales bacterium]|nr:hypothetical protein [Spirochaetales bacterium]
MKKFTLLLIVVLIIAGTVYAQDKYLYEPPFEWKSPEIMAQGSSFTANAAGYDSLFTNPAGFRFGKDGKGGDLNLITVQPTWTANTFEILTGLGVLPDEDATDDTIDDSGDSGSVDILSVVMDQVTSNGLGAGAQTSIGWVGRGLGLGTAVSVDSYFPQAESVLGANGQVWATVAFVGGYTVQFDFLGANIKIGGDLRPMYRIKIDNIDLDTASSFMAEDDTSTESEEMDLTGIPLLAGTAFGIDAGMQATWGWITLGASLRDIGNTTFTYQKSDVGTFLDNSGSMTNAVAYGDAADELEYKTPGSLRLGVSLHPYIPFLSFLVDPIVHAEYTAYLVGDDFYEDGWTQGSMWSRVDVGAEVTLIKLLKLRGGYQGGYLSAGFGLDLLFLEVNAAIYSNEIGAYSGDEQSMGGSLNVSLRF